MNRNFNMSARRARRGKWCGIEVSGDSDPDCSLPTAHFPTAAHFPPECENGGPARDRECDIIRYARKFANGSSGGGTACAISDIIRYSRERKREARGVGLGAGQCARPVCGGWIHFMRSAPDWQSERAPSQGVGHAARGAGLDSDRPTGRSRSPKNSNVKDPSTSFGLRRDKSVYVLRSRVRDATSPSTDILRTPALQYSTGHPRAGGHDQGG